MPVDVEKTVRRFHIMDGNRANWKNQWEDCARFGAPRRMGAIGQRTDGDRRVTPQIYNPIGIQCVQTLAAALHGMVMNPATKWLNIRMMDEQLDDLDSARDWCNGVAKRISNTLASPYTAFHPAANQLLEDLACLGTGVFYIGQQKTGHLFVRTYPIYECCIAENEYGFVDTVIRDSMYTVRQIVNIWGAKAPDKVRQYYDQSKYDEKFKVLCSTEPRPDNMRDTRLKTREHMPIAVSYIFEPEQTLLEESGVEEMPYSVPRWWVASGEVNGRSPFMTALPQVKVSNAATKTIMDAAEKAVSPPLTVPHENLVGPVRSGPNGITYLRNKAEIGQIPTSSQLPYAGEYLQQLDNAIRTTMFVDQVQFVGDFKMTATEVIQRQTERMRLLGPVLGRLETEFLNPFITRVFGIMARNNMFERAPQEIHDADLRIEYQSPLARAQKSQIAQGFQQVIAILEPLAQLGPEIAQQLFAPIDLSKITPALFDWFGVDTDLLKKDDDQAATQQQTQMQKLMQMLPGLAKALRDGSAGMQHLATASSVATDAAGKGAALQRAVPPQAAAPTPAQPGTPGQPGGQNLSELLGSLMRGAAQQAPSAVGVPADVSRAYMQGAPQ